VQKGEQFSKRNNFPKRCTVNTYTVSGFRELQKLLPLSAVSHVPCSPGGLTFWLTTRTLKPLDTPSDGHDLETETCSQWSAYS